MPLDESGAPTSPVIRLVGAVLANSTTSGSPDRRYLSEGSMAKIDPVSDTGLVAAIEAGD